MEKHRHQGCQALSTKHLIVKKKEFITPIPEVKRELGEFNKNSHCVEHSKRQKFRSFRIWKLSTL